MTFVLRLALDTLVLPAAPVAIAAAVARTNRTASTVAAAAGIILAHVIEVGVPRIPPIDTIGWIPLAVAVAAAGVLVEHRALVRLAVTFVVVAIATRLIGRTTATPWCLLAGSVAALADGSLDLASRRMAPAATTLSLSVAMAGASITCLFGHSALLAQVLGASAFVIGVTAIFVEPARTVASIAVVATVSVLVYARLYAELSTLATALLVASAVAPSAASWLPLARRVRPIVAVITAVAFSITAALCARA